jgi:3-hydroxyisobutyrate dehydrogenase-like beta-hydroxyacid dehydrogenase
VVASELQRCPKLASFKPVRSARSEIVGVVGLGLMGTAFASNLLSRGYKVHVYNRTKQKAEHLVARGAVLHTTPKDLASNVDVILTSLTDQNAIDALAFGVDGFLSSMRKGTLWIDASTIDPTASIRHAEAAKKLGIQRLDTPVVGSEDLAATGQLLILVGGTPEIFERYEGFLNELGKTVVFLGVDGNGHKMKLIVNLYLGLMSESFSEALVLAQKEGFDVKTFVDVINKTAHRNAFTESKGPKIAAGNFEPAFSLNNLLKDLRLAERQANVTSAILPMSKIALDQYAKAAEHGLGEKDIIAITLELQRENKLAS